MVRRPRVLPLVLAALLLVPAVADAQSLDEVRAERARIQERLDAAAATLSDLESREARLEDEQSQLRHRLDALARELAAADARVRLRVRAVYKGGSADPVVVLLSGGDPEAAVERAMLIGRLVGGDRNQTERAENTRTELRAVGDRLEDTEAELAAAVAERRATLEDIESDLERAQALEERLEAEERARQEEERRRREEERARQARVVQAPSGGGSAGGDVSTGGMACPVARPHSFSDTWGAPRSGGRRHQGTDILAPRGQTVLAIVSGVWDVRSYGRSAGHWAILRGDDGHAYYYMHLETHVVGDGARVAVGQQVATNGDTGNARGTPHVHFELHPGGGGPVNPYPTLRRICG